MFVLPFAFSLLAWTLDTTKEQPARSHSISINGSKWWMANENKDKMQNIKMKIRKKRTKRRSSHKRQELNGKWQKCYDYNRLLISTIYLFKCYSLHNRSHLISYYYLVCLLIFSSFGFFLSFCNVARRLPVFLLFHSSTWFFKAVVIRFVLSLWYIKLIAAYWQRVTKTHRPSASIKVDCVALHVFISVLKNKFSFSVVHRLLRSYLWILLILPFSRFSIVQLNTNLTWLFPSCEKPNHHNCLPLRTKVLRIPKKETTDAKCQTKWIFDIDVRINM